MKFNLFSYKQSSQHSPSVHRGGFGRLALCAALLLSLSGCGLFDDDDKPGTVNFDLETSDSPTKPNINVPENTSRFLMELISETGQNASDSSDSSEAEADSGDDDNSGSDESSERASLRGIDMDAEYLDADNDAEGESGAADDGSDDTEDDGSDDTEDDGSDDTEDDGSDDTEGDGSDDDGSADGEDDSSDGEEASSEASSSGNGVETTCSIFPASYSVSQDYKAGDSVSMSISDVASGSWILRVSALDSSNKVLAHFQKAVTLSSGQEADMSGWLNSGPAPEGYFFMSSPGSSAVTRLSLMSEDIQELRVSGHYPAVLFFKEGLAAPVGSLLHAITGATDLLDLSVKTSGTDCDIDDQYIPGNNSCVASDGSAVISYYNDNGVRFYDYDSHTYSDLLYTGNGASELSNVVNGYVWVSNEKSRDLTKIDIANQTTVGGNFSSGDTVKKLKLNDTGSRMWTLCMEPTPCVRVIDTAGSNLDNYTTQIVSPSDLWIVDDLVCVNESSRAEVVFFEESDTCNELERIPISEGVGDVVFSDGYRLYVKTNQSSLAVVDLATRSYNKTIKITGECSSMVLMH